MTWQKASWHQSAGCLVAWFGQAKRHALR